MGNLVKVLKIVVNVVEIIVVGFVLIEFVEKYGGRLGKKKFVMGKVEVVDVVVIEN